MTVVEAVEGLGRVLGREVEECPEFAAALALARELDSFEVSATAKAACARSLSACLERVRLVVPEGSRVDRLDELAGRRVERRAAS